MDKPKRPASATANGSTTCRDLIVAAEEAKRIIEAALHGDDPPTQAERLLALIRLEAALEQERTS